MRDLRDDGYSIEIFFVFADMPIMEKRAKQREKDTGRQTDIEQVSSLFLVPSGLYLFDALI
jgi:hypothetical protein